MSTWSHDGGQVDGYMYYYDAYNRLSRTETILDGIYADLGDFTEQYNYNKQGNITSLYRANDEDYIDVLFMNYNGNRLVSVQNTMSMVPDYQTMHYRDNANATTEFGYDNNGNLIYDKDRGISTIRYNVLNLPDRIQYSNGNQTYHEYDALGNRVRTTYYTRKSLTAVPIGNILHPENNTSDYTITIDGFNDNIVYTKVNPAIYNGTTWLPKFVHNPEGMMRHYSYEEHYPFYFIKDHLGNIRETYIIPAPNTKYFIQSMQYYPSGIPWKTSTGAIEHPYRYNGKELVQMHGQDEYDSNARWYYPAICRTTTMDPLCEKYYNISPYAWCGNNFANAVDLNGMDWYSTSDSSNQIVISYNEDIHCQEDLDNQNIQGTYIGAIAELDGKYYSLFGTIIDSKSDVGELYKAIDNALIKLAEYEIASSSEMSSFSEDMHLPRTKFDIPKLSYGQNVDFQYEGGYGIYTKVQYNKAYNELFPNIKKPPVYYGGWQKSRKSYPLVFKNDKGWDVVTIKFYDYETAKRFVDNYHKQFFYK